MFFIIFPRLYNVKIGKPSLAVAENGIISNQSTVYSYPMYYYYWQNLIFDNKKKAALIF